MRITVLSDTHTSTVQVPYVIETLRTYLVGIDLILHAGDVIATELLDALSEFAPVEAVAGNMDGHSIRECWPEQQTICVQNHRIGLIHGWGSPNELTQRVWQRFQNESSGRLDAIVFGHSHHALIEEQHGVLMLNPGSPTDRRWAPCLTLAELRIEAGGLHPSIINLEETTTTPRTPIA